MSADAFELLSLTMRYVFTALILLIVLRAARGALVDSRRAAKLRRLSPMTGISGELIVLETANRIPRGMRYPVIREGTIGSSRRTDIRLRHPSIRRRHALFQLTASGLHIRTHAGARLLDALGNPAKELTLLDGDTFSIGGVRFLLVLSIPDLPRRPVRVDYASPDESSDELFDLDSWLDEHATPSDPVSPIFDRPADPFDGEPLHARPREQRRQTLRRPEPPRRAVDSDIVSPIFDPDDDPPIPDDWANSRQPSRRAFLEDDDDLFMTEPSERR